MLAIEESLSSSSYLLETFTEVKCMIRMTYVAITRRGLRPPDVGMVTQISAPPSYLKVLPTPLVIRFHRSKINITKHLMQGRNNKARVGVEP